MRYLVTGGCGFIGSHLVDGLIDEGHELIVLDDLSTGKRDNIPTNIAFIEGDIRDQEVVQQIVESSIDGCFHLAAIASVEKSVQEWTHTHLVNQSATVQLFDLIAKQEKFIPVVYASSSAVYGNNPNVPLTESDEKRILTAYAADKYGCELHAKVAGYIHNTPSIGLRFFNVYGPRQDPSSPYSGVISIFATRIPIEQEINIYGDGKHVRDFIYVKDVVRALLRSMKELERSKIKQDIYNVCTGKETSVLELADLIGKITNKKIHKQFLPDRRGNIRKSVGNPQKLEQELGIKAQTLLEEGLSVTIKAMQE